MTKDYYKILGVPEDANHKQIKDAFRKLAFKHHPDTNPGREKQAEAEFKEINEAYGVLGNDREKQRYDFARKHQFNYGSTYGGFPYSQQDIFRSVFSDPNMLNELGRIFQQANLRFDQDFLSRVFFQSNNTVFRDFSGFGTYNANSASDQRTSGQPDGQTSGYRPSWLERLLSKLINKIIGFTLKRLILRPQRNARDEILDKHFRLEITPAEASSGSEKLVSFEQEGKTRKLMVKIPRGIKNGSKIRLRGMGYQAGNQKGNILIHISIG